MSSLPHLPGHIRPTDAREQILSGNRKVTEVCFDVGFKNLSHFSRAYKAMFGCSPSTVSEPRAEPTGKQI